jgi:hypothetical protein
LHSNTARLNEEASQHSSNTGKNSSVGDKPTGKYISQRYSPLSQEWCKIEIKEKDGGQTITKCNEMAIGRKPREQNKAIKK